MRQVSRPVRRGAGRKGRKDLARSLPGFKVLGVLFLGEVYSAFLPSKKACWAHQFRYLEVDQQYPFIDIVILIRSWPHAQRTDHKKDTINWLQVLGATELAQIDQRVRHQFHAIVPLLDTFKS